MNKQKFSPELGDIVLVSYDNVKFMKARFMFEARGRFICVGAAEWERIKQGRGVPGMLEVRGEAYPYMKEYQPKPGTRKHLENVDQILDLLFSKLTVNEVLSELKTLANNGKSPTNVYCKGAGAAVRTPKYGDRILVAEVNKDVDYRGRIFIALTPDEVLCVASHSEDDFLDGKKFDTCKWPFWKPVPKMDPTFSDYQDELIRKVAASMGIPYEVLTRKN